MSHRPGARKSKPPSNRDDALAVLHRLREHGHGAYFAGGCVRDMLLGLSPTDFDVATDAPPRRVRELFRNTQAVGVKFGVILVKHRASTVEVATFRSEGSYSDGRRPDTVRFTTAEEDARRRDFTINGMFFDPIDQRVVDYVGGQQDLAARVLRAIGDPDERFEEDHLRLLRAVRFAARFDFSIEPGTRQAIVRHAELLPRISPERIADELRLMLTVPTRNAAWAMLSQLDLTRWIFRFSPMPVDSDPNRALFPRLAGETISFGLALAAAALSTAHDLAAQLHRQAVLKSTRAMRQALRISNEESDEMRDILIDAGMLLSDPPPGVAALRRFLARPHARATRNLLDALMQIAPHPNEHRIKTDLSRLEQLPCAPVPFITGEDLLTTGLPAGPLYKKILDQVYDAQLEDRVQSREQAMELARQLSK